MGCNACLKVCTALSARPFVAGWCGADVIWRMPLDLKNAWNSSETNCAPLSLMICSGIPNLANKSHRTSMVELEVLELTEITSGHLLCASTTTTLSCNRNQPRTMHIAGVSQRSWQELAFLGGKWQ